MRRFLTACALGASMLVSLGCCATLDSTITAAKGSVRDLRTVRAKVVPMLPIDDVKIGNQTWTVRGLWDNRLAAMIVRERSIVAGLTGDKTFDVRAASAEEGVTQEPR